MITIAWYKPEEIFEMPVHKKIRRIRISETQGWGLEATGLIKHGTLLVEDVGHSLRVDEYFRLPDWARELAFVITEDVFLAPMFPGQQGVSRKNIDDCWYVNHSCTPNTRRRDFFSWEACCDIQKGEQITCNYAFLQVSRTRRHMRAHEDWDFNCDCGTPQCRLRITDRDWCLPEFLSEEYDGQFPSYIDDERKRLRQSRKSRIRTQQPTLVVVGSK